VNSQTQPQATLKTASGDLNTPHSISCLFGGLNGKTLTLSFENRPMISGPVSVEFNDTLFLGEIVRYFATSDGLWQMEIMVEQLLTGLQSLLRFREQLLGEGAGPAPERVAARPVQICA